MNKKGKSRNANIFIVILISFLTLVILGSVLLCLPISSAERRTTPFIDTVFTSASAVCVTGLSVYDTGTYWSLFGKIVILLLIQTGGLGLMTFFAIVSFLISNRLSTSTRKMISEATAADSGADLKSLLKFIFLITFSFEFSGACLLCIRLIPVYGAAKGIFASVFTSVSAFCNAGFDVFGDLHMGASLAPFSNDPFVLIVLSVLIICGGLGFVVWQDILKKRKWKDFYMHSKIVLIFTAALLLFGFLIMFPAEFSNEDTCGGESVGLKILHAFFSSVTPRTAGFAVHDYENASGLTVFSTCFLMLIGGAPGSTAGGIKVTVLAIFLLSFVAASRGSENVNFFKKRLDKNVLQKACAIITAFAAVIFTGTVLLLLFGADIGENELVKTLFEVISAVSNTGLSMGITASENIFAKLVLSVIMFLGRVGLVSFAFSLFGKNKTKVNNILYPEGKIFI